ncbi:MAG: type II CAAX endopeptidase family protein [Candidatus Altiarchaeia archaeon]
MKESHDVGDKKKPVLRRGKKNGRHHPVHPRMRLTYAGLAVYLLLLTSAEYITTYVNPEGGLAIHAFILFALLTVSSFLYKDKLLCCFVMSLVITPLIRILSTAMPVSMLDPLYWFLAINFPLLIMAFMLMGYLGLTREDVGLVFVSPEEENRKIGFLLQFLVMFTGPFFGMIEYHILRPEAMVQELTVPALISAFVTFTIFTGLIEEIVFRGIIQRNGEKVIGVAGALFFTALLFAVMHIGWKSWVDLVFVFLVGFFYGVIFYKTRSLFGITVSHGLTNTVLFTIAPLFIR